MALGLRGYKEGMTRIFHEGESIPVSVIVVRPNKVTQIKTVANDGYSAIQVTSGEKHANRVNKPTAGHYAKAGVQPGLDLNEFRLDVNAVANYNLGDTLDVSMFEVGQEVDVSGKSKGKGFSGAIKRHNFSSQRASHGNSLSHNAPGSIGQNQTPGRVFKGKKMAGQLGNVNCTSQTLKIVQVDVDKGVLLVRGAIPGARGGLLTIKPAVRAKAAVAAE